MKTNRALGLSLLFLLSTATVLTAAKAKDKPIPSSECISISEVGDRIGERVCVRATLLYVSTARTGTTFLNFCEDRNICPFVAVVFARDLDDVGDLTKLKGRTIELEGRLKDYKGQPEIVIRDRKQLRGNADLPALPAEFGAERGKATNLGQYPRDRSRGRAW